MKRRIVLITLFIVCMSCSWISGAIAQTEYVMVCKGGGDMVGTIRQDYNHAVNLDDVVTASLVIVFRASPQAASRQEPAPGTCAWVDRPLHSQEQQHMYLSYGWRRKQVGVSLINIHHQRYDIPLDASIISDPSLRYLFDALYNGKLFYVRCSYSQSTHRFEITRVGP